MNLNIRALSNRIGMDSAIAYTVLSRILQAIGGVFSVIIIGHNLTKIEQGYYFTFGSILAIQIFFELGLSNIITQFVAHEMAHLHWENSSRLTGSQEAISRLSSLLRFCVKWFFVVALLLTFILLITGFFFFNEFGKGNETVIWRTPWILLSLCTSCSLMISPVLAFLEGLGKVKEVAKIRLFQQICQMLILYLLLLFGFKLYASPIAACVALVIPPIFVFFSIQKQLLIFIWGQLNSWKVNYRKEIFPYQWRIALSWISGYFIFQLFNPVLFVTEGAIVAGQMGMTLTSLSGILAISISWINTKVPLFSSLISKKDYGNLDQLFNKTVKQASLICGFCLIIFFAIIGGLQYFNFSIGYRFLPLFPLSLLCASTFANQFISALATYLRCHKQEPFLIQSITLGLLTATSTFFLGKSFGLHGIVVGYSFLIIIVSLFWSIIIFKNKKALWHRQIIY